MSSITRLPTLPARGLSSIVLSCAACAVSALFAGGMLLIMR